VPKSDLLILGLFNAVLDFRRFCNVNLKGSFVTDDLEGMGREAVLPVLRF
jgi:hypothetical protein